MGGGTDRSEAIPIPEIGPRSTAGEVLQAGLARSVRRLIEQEPLIRANDDPEGLHRARVACRRLRSDLRTLAPLLEPGWADPIRAELRWLGGVLGAVRDLDVLRTRLDRQIADLPPLDQSAADAVLVLLEDQRRRALEAAISALDSRRHADLLEVLAEAAAHPALTAAAARPAIEVVPPLAARAVRRLRRHVRRLPEAPSDEALHDLRIQAKRARYATDLAVPVVGPPAARSAKALRRLQDILGDLHDAVVAERWLRDAAQDAPGPTAFVLGELALRQRDEAAALRRRWPKHWRRVDRPKRTAWM